MESLLDQITEIKAKLDGISDTLEQHRLRIDAGAVAQTNIVYNQRGDREAVNQAYGRIVEYRSEIDKLRTAFEAVAKLHADEIDQLQGIVTKQGSDGRHSSDRINTLHGHLTGQRDVVTELKVRIDGLRDCVLAVEKGQDDIAQDLAREVKLINGRVDRGLGEIGGYRAGLAHLSSEVSDISRQAGQMGAQLDALSKMYSERFESIAAQFTSFCDRFDIHQRKIAQVHDLAKTIEETKLDTVHQRLDAHGREIDHARDLAKDGFHRLDAHDRQIARLIEEMKKRPIIKMDWPARKPTVDPVCYTAQDAHIDPDAECGSVTGRDDRGFAPGFHTRGEAEEWILRLSVPEYDGPSLSALSDDALRVALWRVGHKNVTFSPERWQAYGFKSRHEAVCKLVNYGCHDLTQVSTWPDGQIIWSLRGVENRPLADYSGGRQERIIQKWNDKLATLFYVIAQDLGESPEDVKNIINKRILNK